MNKNNKPRRMLGNFARATCTQHQTTAKYELAKMNGIECLRIAAFFAESSIRKSFARQIIQTLMATENKLKFFLLLNSLLYFVDLFLC